MAIFKTCSKSSGTNDFWDFPKSMKIDEKSLENSGFYNAKHIQIADFPDTVWDIYSCVRASHACYRCVHHARDACDARIDNARITHVMATIIDEKSLENSDLS